MTKSRTALTVLIPLSWAWPAAVAAQAGAPEDAVARQQAAVRDVVTRSCPRGADANDVVVCARREPQRFRAPLRIVQEATPRDLAGGEQLAQLDAGAIRCSPAVHDQRCNRGLSVISVGSGGVGGIVGMMLPGLSEDE